MCQRKHPLDEDTARFFTNWGSSKVRIFDNTISDLKELLKEIVPAMDGTIALFYHDGSHVNAKVFHQTVSLEIQGKWFPYMEILNLKATA